MKKWIIVLLLMSSNVNAKPKSVLNDYGNLLLPDKFSISCTINDPGVSGSAIINAYSNGQISCENIQKLYSNAYTHARKFLIANKYDFSHPAPQKTLSLRILTLAQLNDPQNFSLTDKKCMYDVKCRTGAYFGRAFYSPTSSNINIYVVHNSLTGRYSFNSTLKHELMHAILYRYRWNYFLKENEEHALIDKYLNWKITE